MVGYVQIGGIVGAILRPVSLQRALGYLMENYKGRSVN